MGDHLKGCNDGKEKIGRNYCWRDKTKWISHFKSIKSKRISFEKLLRMKLVFMPYKALMDYELTCMGQSNENQMSTPY